MENLNGKWYQFRNLGKGGFKNPSKNLQIPVIVEHGIFAPENNLVPQNNLKTLIYSLKVCQTTRMDFKIQPGSVCCWASDIQRWDKGTAVSRSNWRGDWDRPEMSASAEGCLISIQLLKYEQRGHDFMPHETLPGGRKWETPDHSSPCQRHSLARSSPPPSLCRYRRAPA